MSDGHVTRGVLEKFHSQSEGNIIWKFQCPKTNHIRGKQALVVSLEGLWENMSPSVPVEPAVWRQHRKPMSFLSCVHWCLMRVYMEPDGQRVLRSSWSHSLRSLSSSFPKILDESGSPGAAPWLAPLPTGALRGPADSHRQQAASPAITHVPRMRQWAFSAASWG